MRQQSGTRESSSKRLVKNIRRVTRKQYSSEPGFPRWLLPIAEKSNTIGIPKAIPTRSCHDRLGSALDRVCLAMRNSAP